MAVPIISFEHRLGDTLSREVIAKDTDGAAIDITGYTTLCQLRQTKTGTLLLTATVTIDPDQANNKGKLTVDFTAAQMKTLTGGVCYFVDVQLTSPAGVVKTIVEYNILIDGDVSRV